MSTSRPVALITGGHHGIGHATARLLHEQGFRILFIGTNPEMLPAAQGHEPESPNPRCRALKPQQSTDNRRPT